MKAAAPKNIVVIGGGIQGTSVAYQLSKKIDPSKTTIRILEAKAPASAASGKGGGFMAASVRIELLQFVLRHSDCLEIAHLNIIHVSSKFVVGGWRTN